MYMNYLLDRSMWEKAYGYANMENKHLNRFSF